MGRGATQRRAVARQEMREDILRTAREMIASEGLANLSLRGIARSLGYSPAALYEYFASKEAIAKALYFEGAEGLAGQMDRALEELPAGTPPLEAKKTLGRAYRAYAQQNRELFLLVFGSGDSFSTLSEQLGAGNNGYEALLSVVNQGLNSGEFVAAPAEALAFTAWASVHGFVMLELACVFDQEESEPAPHIPPEATPDELFELHMELIDLGMRRR